MAIYVITGGTTGIGAVVREHLQSQGHEVFNIDYNQGDCCVDLSFPEGRQTAVKEVFRRYPDGIDCFICNAGVGPYASPSIIFSLNFFAPVHLAEAFRPLLKKKKGNCVVTASNSITNLTVRTDWVDMLTNVMDEDRILEMAADIPLPLVPSCYSSSKHAVTRWVRRISPSWAADGLRINVVAPGNTNTPMTQGMTPEQKNTALFTPIPTRYYQKEFLDAQEIAHGILFLTSSKASGINGVVLFIDGGVDALLRSERF